MNKIDRSQLLLLLQTGLEIQTDPWASLAERLNVSRDALCDEIFALRAEGILRDVAGLFDLQRLGYARTLAAMEVYAPNLDAAGAAVAEHPGISHCYSRSGALLTLWVTLAVSPTSQLGLSRTLKILGKRARAHKIVSLPVEKPVKLNVRFDADGRSQAQPPVLSETRSDWSPTDMHRRAICVLQRDLPVCQDPLASLLKPEDNMNISELLAAASELKAAGVLRRYAGVMNHRTLGVRGNVMAVWAVAAVDQDRAIQAARQSPAVSHAYFRRAVVGWPFNFYTMIHAPSIQQAVQAVEQLRPAVKSVPKLLWTEKEYKKQRVKIMGSQETQWESQYI